MNHDPTVATAVRKLSTQQADTLQYFWSVHQTAHANAHGGAYVCGGKPSSRASMSRTLARLERRGLILRQNEHTDCRTAATDPRVTRRTTHVSFTTLGKEVAKALATDHVTPC